MVNATKTCQEPFCGGKMVKAREQKACVPGTSDAETGFTVDIYECAECGAEDWE